MKYTSTRKQPAMNEESKRDRNFFFDFKNSSEDSEYLWQRAREGGDGAGHGCRLLGDEGVAGVGDYDDGDAIA